MNSPVAPGKLPVDVLASASIFSSLSREELETLAGKCELVDRGGAEVVFDAGDASDRLYVVASGSVVIRSPEGGSILAEFVSGDSFGELEFLTRARRNARAITEGETRLLAFPSKGEDLKTSLSDKPDMAARILRSFLLVVAGRTRQANALVKENSPLVRELKRQVYGDKLTGLLNKAYLEENLPGLLASPLALVMMKPDNFKEINDRFGHEVGDAVLVHMATEFERAVGRAGTAVRYMGNELAAVYPGMDRPAAREAAAALQARLALLDLSGLTGESGLALSTSYGIVLSPEHGLDAEALIKTAAGLPLVGRARGGSLILFPEDGA
jgi:diguanylate cyclase (GGDEF)-like protein